MRDILTPAIKFFSTASILLLIAEIEKIISMPALVFWFVIITMVLLIILGFITLMAGLFQVMKLDYFKVAMAILGGAEGIKATFEGNAFIELIILTIFFAMFNISIVLREDRK